jgi:tetratricopeptide (TPR) repeat protein
VYSHDAFPKEWAMTKTIQGNAYLKRTSGIPRDNIEQAIACYSAALEVYTPDAFPLERAKVLRNLAIAVGKRMVGSKRINREKSIVCYEAALEIYTRDGFPEEWAGIQNDLGVAYYKPLDGKSLDPEKAIAHYEAALQIFTLDSFPIDYLHTQLNLALAEAGRQNWLNVHKACSQAFAAEEILVPISTGIAGRDAVLKEGKDAATNDCFALTRLGQADAAAVAMERGRARGLAEALALDMADAQKISDSQRRQRYESARQQFTSAQTSLNTPIPSGTSEREQRQIHLERSEVYQKARQALNEAIAEIRAAHDPANFLEDTLVGQLAMA